jgi:hypothetical protein
MFVGGAMQDFGTTLTNHGHVVFTDFTVVEGTVTNHAAITALYDVTFNDSVSGAGGFFGPGTVTFNGGLSPGASPAVVRIENDVVLGDDNTLTIELAGEQLGQFDRLELEGFAAIDGALEVQLIDGFVPSVGDSFGFLFASRGFGGTFDELLLPDLGPGKTWQLNPGGATVFLNVVSGYSADFDEDGDVDGNDLTRWQSDFGVNDLSDADEDGDSDGADFLAWQRQLASTASVAATSAVPEPAPLLLIVSGALAMFLRRRVAVS